MIARQRLVRCSPILIASLAASTACSDGPTEPRPGSTSASAPGNGPRVERRQRIIVTLSGREDARTLAEDYGVEPRHVYTRVLNGFAGSVSEAARERLLQDARVASVDRDPQLVLQATDAEQPGAPWGLDRIDQRNRALDGIYGFDRTGAGVRVYIVDSGLRYSHAEFEGRARAGFDAFGEDGSDCFGHGTHVAGIVGGATYGVAKAVELVSVRVLNCGGWGNGSDLIAAMEWMAADRQGPAVANMSLAFHDNARGGKSPVDAAVRNLIASGVTVVAAAANYATDACDYTPARVAEAITVGSTGRADQRSSFSNWGGCVDWFAPGESVVSASWESDDASTVKTGTSMAAPHTAGAAALLLEASPDLTATQVAEELYAWTTKSIVADANSANDHLLFSRGETTEPPQLNEPPTAAFSFACAGLSCQFDDTSADPDGTVAGWAWDFAGQGASAIRDPTFTFASAGTWAVGLTVTDDDGSSACVVRDVTVDSAPQENQLPTASFSYACQALECAFTDQSSDEDGTVAGWSWSFGPGAEGSSEANPTHTFLAGGTYTVTLTVSDDDGGTANTQRSVTVAEPVAIQLTASAYKDKGWHTVTLSWSGATGGTVDVFRDGALLDSAPNGGSYTDEPGGRGKATYHYRVCEAGSTACSAVVEVSF